MLTRHTAYLTTFFLAFTLALPATARADEKAPSANKIQTAKAYRGSTLIGMSVKNNANENIGHVEDLLINVETGRATHAILSFGGVLGIGEKLFPIPWRELTLRHDEDKAYLIVDVSEDFLDKAPSFDRNMWPDMTPAWVGMVEEFFPSHAGVFVAATGEQLTMSYAGDIGEHAHAIASDVVVTRDGRPATLKDLRQGDQLRVTLAEQAGIHLVTKIAATSPR